MFKRLRSMFLSLFSRHEPATNSLSDTTTEKNILASDESWESLKYAGVFPMPYDENLLKRVRTQWQFGDWKALTALNRDSFENHPQRARLALLAAAGHLQQDNTEAATQLIRMAQDWGCGKRLIAQVLCAGVHNTLGRAAAITGNQERAISNFEKAIEVGSPGAEIRLLTQARLTEQLAQLGLLNSATVPSSRSNEANWLPRTSGLEPLLKRIQEIESSIAQQNADAELRTKLQTDEVIRARNSLDANMKRAINNAAKQIEAFIGLQSYFTYGELPNFNVERHAWPISPDFAIYLIELLEANDYDIVIEFGSGISTTIIAKCIVKMAGRRATSGKKPVEFLSFEHLDKYYKNTRTHLTHAGLLNTVNLVHAPLTDYLAPNGTTYPYYNCQQHLTEVSKRYQQNSRIFVVIDGPPGDTGKHARYPAAPIILATFKDAHIDLLLDDYIREDEKEITRMWKAEMRDANIKYTTNEYQLEKDACLITIEPTSVVKH